MSIFICDSIMGSGKTSAAINYINQHYDKRFIYITPYLDEDERIVKECDINKIWGEDWGEAPAHLKQKINFRQPDDKRSGSKLKDLKYLLKNKSNIATTHSLFASFDSEVFDLIEAAEYTLFIDESPSVIEIYNDKFDNKNKYKDNKDKVDKNKRITCDDVGLLLKTFIDKDDSHILKWNEKNYNGRFNDIKKLCELEALGVYNNNILIWMQPIRTFTCFEDIFVLTYMFEGQLLKYYFDINGLSYEYYISEKTNGNYQFKKVDEPPKTSIDKTLINIYDGSLNDIGEDQNNSNNCVDSALSKSWYNKASSNKASSEDRLDTLKNHLYNYFRNEIHAKSKDIMWTCYKDYESDLKKSGYAKSFVECNIKATNDYKERSTVAYMINFFANPTIIQFFNKYNIKVNEDKYSLSMLLQFIWRSRIRENKPINLYIPSKRMRELLLEWLG